MLSLKFLYNNPLGSLITNLRERACNQMDGSTRVVSASKEASLDSDQARASYIRSIPRAQWFRNVLLQGYLCPASILKGLEDFEIRPDDIFVVSYPKSGTTWTEEILSLIVNDGDLAKVNNKLLVYRVEHLEVGRPIGHLRHLRKLKSPRLMATHLSLPLIPKQLQQAKCKIIYVVRNPKDNAVSYFHHHRMSTFLGNYNGGWDEFLAHYLKGHLVYGSWFDHVLPYWKFSREHPDKVLFISFEELKMDLPGMIVRISQFVGHPLTPEAVQIIARHCSFEQMKNNSMVNREVLPVTDMFDMTKSKFMRKGIIGDWKNYFTDDQNELFDKLYTLRMRDSGLDLVFEPEAAFQRMSLHGRLIVEPGLQSAGTKNGLSQQDSRDSLDSRDSALATDEDITEEEEEDEEEENPAPVCPKKENNNNNHDGAQTGDKMSDVRASFIALPPFQAYTLPDPLVFDMVR